MPEPALRSLPRVFFELASSDEPFELPQFELDKLRKVLRLGTGDPIAVLPNDGSIIRCRLQGRSAVPERVEWPKSESPIRLTLAQALPKGDRLETVLRMGTEIGIARFLLFPAERSVVRWDQEKLGAKLRRLAIVVREAAEQSFRTNLPEIVAIGGLREVLESEPQAIVLSELESVRRTLVEAVSHAIRDCGVCVVAGPEGGWTPKETALIGERGVTLGPRVLRTDTAGVAAAAAILLHDPL
jgi:16S rRNA (uracil1498-N3)-methyltransferase